MRSLILFTFVLLLTSCGDQATAVGDAMDSAKETAGDAMETATETAGDAMETATETAGDLVDKAGDMVAPSEELSATIEAVKSAGGDITALSPEAAVGNIDTWIGKLGSMEGTEDIVGSLKGLKAELTSGDIDGGKVSGILTTLAAKTRELGDGNMALGTIASALEAGAKKLGGE